MEGPPEAPATALRLSELSNTRVGDMEEAGLLPGLIVLVSDGTRPYLLGVSGFVEKSSISLLKMMPELGDMITAGPEVKAFTMHPFRTIIP